MNALSLSGMETHLNFSEVVKIPQKDVSQIQGNDAPQRPGQSSFENLCQKFLCSLTNGSKQDQKQHLSEIYHRHVDVRRKTCGRPMPRSQFLESVQCFAESQGLVFGKHLQNMRFGALLHS